MVSSWESEMSLDMVVAKNLHHGSYTSNMPQSDICKTVEALKLGYECPPTPKPREEGTPA